MAMSAVYTTIDGELLSESRNGVSTLYVPDPLGSLVEARDASGAKAYDVEYWAYGEIKAETGANPSPWGFVGLLGYLRDLADLLYVRARHYRPGLARWQTADPLWPDESAYGYAAEQPTSWIDPSGLRSGTDPFGDWRNSMECYFRSLEEKIFGQRYPYPAPTPKPRPRPKPLRRPAKPTTEWVCSASCPSIGADNLKCPIIKFPDCCTGDTKREAEADAQYYCRNIAKFPEGCSPKHGLAYDCRERRVT